MSLKDIELRIQELPPTWYLEKPYFELELRNWLWKTAICRNCWQNRWGTPEGAGSGGRLLPGICPARRMRGEPDDRRAWAKKFRQADFDNPGGWFLCYRPSMRLLWAILMLRTSGMKYIGGSGTEKMILMAFLLWNTSIPMNLHCIFPAKGSIAKSSAFVISEEIFTGR